MESPVKKERTTVTYLSEAFIVTTNDGTRWLLETRAGEKITSMGARIYNACIQNEDEMKAFAEKEDIQTSRLIPLTEWKDEK